MFTRFQQDANCAVFVKKDRVLAKTKAAHQMESQLRQISKIRKWEKSQAAETDLLHLLEAECIMWMHGCLIHRKMRLVTRHGHFEPVRESVVCQDSSWNPRNEHTSSLRNRLCGEESRPTSQTRYSKCSRSQRSTS